MKANVNRITNKQRKAMMSEIRRQCVENTRQYEIEMDSVVLWVLHRCFGFGKARIERFYDAYFKERRAMQDFFEDYDGECMAEYAMREELKKIGVDVERMYSSQEDSQKFRITIK